MTPAATWRTLRGAVPVLLIAGFGSAVWLLLAPAIVAAQPATVTIQQHLTPGNEVRYEVIHSQRGTVSDFPRYLVESRQVAREAVIAAEDDALLRLRAEIETIRHTRWSLEEGEQSYDSEVDEMPSDPELQMYARLVGFAREVELDSVGRGTLTRFGPRMFTPGDRPVSVGDTWSHDSRDEGGSGGVAALLQYRLVKIDDTGEGIIAHIEGTLEMTDQQGAPHAGFSSIGGVPAGPWSLRILFDVDRGLVLEQERVLEYRNVVDGEDLLFTAAVMERVLR